MIHLTPAELIAIKRDGGALSKQMIDDVVLGITDMSLSDAQVGAFAMAVRIRGMNIDETVQLTDAMRRSGTSITWNLDGPVVDKHSTGGVGDTVSLMLAPMLAVCGAFVPMISGLESNRFIPNLTILNGLRSNNSGWEFAFGPTIDVSRTLDGQLDSRGEISFSTALVFSVGKTVKSGEMNFPINAFLIPPKDGSSYRFGLSMGWNAAKKKRLFKKVQDL